jgi:streptogramin lyase
LAISYQVDPSWPQRPADLTWSDVPGVSVDAHDHVWVFTRTDVPVQEYEVNGKFIQAWGKGIIKRAHRLRFDQQGNVWLADIGNHVVLECTPDGRVLRTLGTKGEAGDDQTHLDKPTDMAIAPAGDVFVSDGYGNNRIVHYDRDGKFVKAWGGMGTAAGEFSLPHAIAMDSKGRLYVADRNNNRIQVFDQSGKFLSEWRNIMVPWDIWITKDDDVWVCGSSPMPWVAGERMLGMPPRDQIFVRFNTDGKVQQLWTVPRGRDGQEQPGECNWLHGMALDSQGNIYAGDIVGKRAQKFVRK